MTHWLGDFERRSMAKWEGNALLINTIAIGKKINFTEMVGWCCWGRLSRKLLAADERRFTPILR